MIDGGGTGSRGAFLGCVVHERGGLPRPLIDARLAGQTQDNPALSALAQRLGERGLRRREIVDEVEDDGPNVPQHPNRAAAAHRVGRKPRQLLLAVMVATQSLVAPVPCDEVAAQLV